MFTDSEQLRPSMNHVGIFIEQNYNGGYIPITIVFDTNCIAKNIKYIWLDIYGTLNLIKPDHIARINDNTVFTSLNPDRLINKKILQLFVSKYHYKLNYMIIDEQAGIIEIIIRD